MKELTTTIPFSVIMPTYNQAGFIRNAIRSLLAQTHCGWELIIVDDGCTDDTKDFISDYLLDDRIRYVRNPKNEGLGHSINRGIAHAQYDHIAYLPSDDFYYPNHLSVMADLFRQNEQVVLVTTSMKSERCDSLLNRKNFMLNGHPLGLPIQLVQAAHKKTGDKWVERNEWESEDLYGSFFCQLIDKGFFICSSIVTCEWVMHPSQRFRLMSEKFGGNVNKYRQYYNIKTPLKLKVSAHKFLDEEKAFSAFRKQCRWKVEKPLKILIVGELGYNQERICALQEAGHQLYGLWMRNPTYSLSSVGPLPFGDVEDLDYDNWEQEVDRIQPDVVYGLLNFSAVPIAYEVLRKKPDIPFVWHFKEGPFLCLENGYWGMLVDLYCKSAGSIFTSQEMKEWMLRYIPEPIHSMIMDGDLPKQEHFLHKFSPKLSGNDGEIHTVVIGRMVGITLEDVKELAEHRIHIHVYNENYEDSMREFVKKAKNIGQGYFHQHRHVNTSNWVEEFSQYDAGWLHCFDSQNYGELDKAGWNDLNIPARISTLMAAGIPCIQKDNGGHLVAMQSCIKECNCGIFFKSIDDLRSQLCNKELMATLTGNVKRHRMNFTFDRQ